MENKGEEYRLHEGFLPLCVFILVEIGQFFISWGRLAYPFEKH